VAPMRDEPDADAMPAASPRRQVRRGAVTSAVRRLSRRIAAEAKIRVLKIAERPAASFRGERADLFGNGNRAWVGEGGCRGARRGGLLRRRLDEKGNRRFRRGAAVCPSGDRGGSFDLLDRHHPHGQEVAHNDDGGGPPAGAGFPPPNVPRADGKELRDAALCDAKRVEHRAEFGPDRC